MNADEQLARSVLVAILGSLTDPKYTADPVKSEAALKEAVRATYKVHAPHYPDFVKAYVARWKAEKEGA